MAKFDSVILDDDDSPPSRVTRVGRDPERLSFEWGLASALIGGSFLFIGPVCLLFCLILYNRGHGDYGLSSLDLQLAQVGAYVCILEALVVCIHGLVYGIRGLNQAQRLSLPGALPKAGILLCISALVIWIVVGVDLVAILHSFMRWQRF